TAHNVSHSNWIAGKEASFGSALDFRLGGVFGYVEIDNSGDLNVTDNFSISYWVKINNTEDGGSLMVKGHHSCWLNAIPAAGDEIIIRQSVRPNDSSWQRTDITIPSPNVWHHCVLTVDRSVIDGSTKVLKAYLDGVHQDQATGSWANSSGNLIYGPINTNADNWVFGSGTGDAPTSQYNNPYGLPDVALDDVRFYGVTLTDSDVAAIYGGGAGDFLD
ncbi:MAG: hypothetical protein CL885_02680, partial [Dehalococcoidia bacterium]|nr:hypothetical protein [Dehalococcoidia bacterium]